MAPTRSSAPGLRCRTKKLLTKHQLPVLREDQIESDEYKELLEHTLFVETGVDKSEESEYHLQQALNAALRGGSTEEAKKIVPAPPAEETSAINYDKLYSTVVHKPSSYIRFSETVEECIGCAYNMTTDDEEFLKSYNAKKPITAQCSEDDFEKIMDAFESTAARHAPFAAVDNHVVDLELMEPMLNHQVEEKARGFTKDIYEYWKTRRKQSGNRPLAPSLKLEAGKENDDTDPYLCFRRPDVRQTRKTRARDIQHTDKLRRLRKELEEGRQLIAAVHFKEVAKREQLALERKVFVRRGQVKMARQRAGIKVDDSDLVNQKPQKRKPVEVPQLPRQSGNNFRTLARPDGRPVEADLTLLSDVLTQKENAMQAEIDLKLQAFQRWNQNFIDTTREPLSPVHDRVSSPSFRQATTQYLMTPPPSSSEEASEEAPPQDSSRENPSFQFNSPTIDDPKPQYGYRRRIGRLNRMWIDRRGFSPNKRILTNDAFKYDRDDDSDEDDIVEIDPFDVVALKWRATNLYSPPREARRYPPDPNSVKGLSVVESSVSSSRALSTSSGASTQPT